MLKRNWKPSYLYINIYLFNTFFQYVKNSVKSFFIVVIENQIVIVIIENKTKHVLYDAHFWEIVLVYNIKSCKITFLYG